MTSPDLSRFRECDVLPSLPSQIQRVLDHTAFASSMDYNIVQIIQYDPAIASRVLKIANSPLYGYERQIGSLQQAAGLLGPGVIKSIILTTPILEVWGGPEVPFKCRIDYAGLWRHASATGAISGGLGSAWNGFETDVCFTTGLLHDIGKMAMAILKPKAFWETCIAAREAGKSLAGMEQDRLGFSHRDVARELAEAWNYPESLVQALGSPLAELEGREDPMLALVGLAGSLADEWGVDDGTGLPEIHNRSGYLKRLGRSTQDLMDNEDDLKSYAALVTGD